MNKAAGIGVIVAVVIGIIIVSASFSMESTSDNNELGLEDVVEVEVVEEVEEPEVVEVEVVEEVEEPEVEETGRDLSVEFTESIGLKSP